jgi:hypothetical protein
MKRLFTLLFLLATLGTAKAQTSITSRNTAFTQNFDAMTTADTWTNNITPITGWYAKTDATASFSTFALNNGSTTTAALYSFGTTSDRALGYIASNTLFGSAGTGKAYLGWRLVNNTGATIEQISITYTGEQWRKENNASANSLTVEYQTGTTVTDLTAGTWTSAGAGLTFTSPIVGATTATSIDGNSSANRTSGLTATITFPTPLPNGEEVMIRWVDLNDSGSDHGLAIDDVSVTASSPLPISLVKFEAEKLAEKVKLTWVTATEINNEKFIIERASDGQDFTSIAEIKGAGNSKELNEYTFVDANPLKGTMYYRLTQVDFDGTSTSFEPVAVNSSKGKLSMEQVAGSFEQGAESREQGAWSIYSPITTEASLDVKDVNGKVIYSEKIQLKEGYQNYKLNLSTHHAGIYVLQLIAGKERLTKKVKVN